MFGMGFSEILIILVIGIIFLGPDKLPEAMVKIAKFFNAFKKSINEAKESIDQELKIEELKKEALEYKKKLHETTNSVKSSVYMDEFEEVKNSTNDLVKDFQQNIAKTTSLMDDDEYKLLLEDDDEQTEDREEKKSKDTIAKEKENV